MCLAAPRATVLKSPRARGLASGPGVAEAKDLPCASVDRNVRCSLVPSCTRVTTQRHLVQSKQQVGVVISLLASDPATRVPNWCH